MNFKIIAVIVVAVLAVGAAGIYLITFNKGEEPIQNDQYLYSEDNIISWSYWLGNMDSPGVSDAKTPRSESELTEVWKINDPIDSSSTNWKVPGSAVCVEDRTYFYRGSDSTINCVITATGETIVKATCASDAVYNMAIAYGDGKIFVPALSGSKTIVYVFDAKSLEQLFVSEPLSGGEVQGPIIYYEGKVYLGTYGGDFVCFSSEDTDTSKNDEVVSPLWIIRGYGWYNASPAFFDNYCVIVEKGYDIGGAIAYVVDTRNGAVKDKIKFNLDYCVSGVTAYKGRVYIALNSVTDKSVTPDSSSPKTLVIRSFIINDDGTFNEQSEKEWVSTTKNGGTQSTPVIWNDRLYVGGGGSTMGSSEPFTVINISDDGTMATAYKIDSLNTKGTATITTAYSTAENGYAVYIYLIEYGKVLAGESTNSFRGSADIFILKDTIGQTKADIIDNFTPSTEQFAYQSFTISSDGYLLIRNDTTLFCYGPKSSNVHTYTDVMDTIDRIISMAEEGNVNSADVERLELRYSSLSESDQAKVTNYNDLQNLYCNVTFVVGDKEIQTKYLKGSHISMPIVEVPQGKILIGWGDWNFISDTVEDDINLMAILSDPVTVSFNSDGGSSVGPISIQNGTEMGYVANPEKDGYTFGGWFFNNIEYHPQYSKVLSDITLTAKWLKDSTISFNTDGGSSAGSIAATYSKEIGPLPTTTKNGHKFLGWYYGDTLYTSATVFNFNNDITLTAKWSKNTVSSLDNGKGFVVTGALPEGASLKVVKPFSGSSSLAAIREASGNSNMDFVIVTVSGDGVSGSDGFEVTIPVGASSNGMNIDLYYYKDSKVTQVSGIVSDGKLIVTLYGDSGGGGTQIVFGIANGTSILNNV